jgi:hypothetical protein
VLGQVLCVARRPCTALTCKANPTRATTTMAGAERLKPLPHLLDAAAERMIVWACAFCCIPFPTHTTLWHPGLSPWLNRPP